MKQAGISHAFRDRPLNEVEFERLRLLLSTYRDGTGQINKPRFGGTFPGYRDYERSLAAVLEGAADDGRSPAVARHHGGARAHRRRHARHGGARRRHQPLAERSAALGAHQRIAQHVLDLRVERAQINDAQRFVEAVEDVEARACLVERESGRPLPDV